MTGIEKRVVDLGANLPWTCDHLDIAEESERADSEDVIAFSQDAVRRKVTFKGKTLRGTI